MRCIERCNRLIQDFNVRSRTDINIWSRHACAACLNVSCAAGRQCVVAQVGVNNARRGAAGIYEQQTSTTAPTTANYCRALTHNNICEHANRKCTRQFDSFHDRRRPLPISRIRLLATQPEAPRRGPMVSRANDTITPIQSASRCFLTLSPKCKRRRNVGEA